MTSQSPKMPVAPSWASGVLDFPAVAKRLREMNEFMLNRISRDRSSAMLKENLRLRQVVLASARVAINLHKSSLYLCAAREEDGVRRRDYIMAASPLNRCLLDIVFNLAFLFERPTGRLMLFLRSGWRDLAATKQRHHAAFGKEPEFKSLLSHMKKVVAEMERLAEISAAEKEDPTLIKFWPTPGGMRRDPEISKELEKFFGWLDAWFYGDLSSASHSSFSGLMEHMAFLVALDEAKPDVAERQKSIAAFQAIGLLLAVFSEIEIALKLGAAGRLMGLWQAASTQGEIRSLYQKRYEEKLTAVVALQVARGRG